MTIKSINQMKRKPIIEINLTGPNGNVFYLLALARQLSKQLSKNGDEIIKEMKKGDYNHLLIVFDREFGQYVTLYK